MRQLTSDALQMFLRCCRFPKHVIVHSDQGKFKIDFEKEIGVGFNNMIKAVTEIKYEN